jgi:hypothetical protein
VASEPVTRHSLRGELWSFFSRYPNKRRTLLAPSTRIDPTTLISDLGLQEDKIARAHAEARLTQQMRYFCLLYLLRVKGTISQGETVDESRTVYQFGQGGTEEQAAHKIISTFSVGGKDLLERLSTSAVPQNNNELYKYMIGLISETTILYKGYNEADSYMENNGLRNKVLSLGSKIVERSYENVNLDTDFQSSMKDLYSLFRMDYLNLCSQGQVSCLIEAQAQGVKIPKQEVLIATQQAKIDRVSPLPADPSQFTPEQKKLDKLRSKFQNELRLSSLHELGGIFKSAVLKSYHKAAQDLLILPFDNSEFQQLRRLVDQHP